MVNVMAAAEFFIRIANQSADDQMTNLKVNKLLYYSQGVHLARTGEPLFADPIEPWKLGPVVADVYHAYKAYGREPIPLDGDIDRSLFTDEEYETLLDVMREFGRYTGSVLVSLTHQPDTPWSSANAKKLPTLDEEEIKEYFTKHPVPRLDEIADLPQAEVLPADWYDPDEDEEWEAYL